jgi:hypothetical protein
MKKIFGFPQQRHAERGALASLPNGLPKTPERTAITGQTSIKEQIYLFAQNTALTCSKPQASKWFQVRSAYAIIPTLHLMVFRLKMKVNHFNFCT